MGRRRRILLRGGGSVDLPLALILTWDGDDADATPNFAIDFPLGFGSPFDIQVDDEIVLQYRPIAGGAFEEYFRHTVTQSDIDGEPITVSGVSSLTSGEYEFRGRIERDGTIFGAWSGLENATVDAGIAPPVNTVAPSISGNTWFGQTLTVTPGTWPTADTITGNWQRDGVDISGATSTTYVLVEADAGADITYEEVGTNAGGDGTPVDSNTISTDVYLVHTGAHPVSTVDGTVYTFNDQTLGVEAPNRIILIEVEGASATGNSSNITSVTLEGNSTTRVIQLLADTSNNRGAAIYAIAFPTGTIGDIVVTYGLGQSRAGIGISAMYGASGITPADTDSALSVAGNPTTGGAVTLTVPAKGVALGVTMSGGGAASCTWSGLNESYDQALETTNFASAATLNSNAGGNIAMSAIWNASSTNGAVVFASWGP